MPGYSRTAVSITLQIRVWRIVFLDQLIRAELPIGESQTRGSMWKMQVC
jgi:hypothetical protein